MNKPEKKFGRSLLIVYLVIYWTLTSSSWPPGGGRVILSILSFPVGEVPDEISFIFFSIKINQKLVF